MHCVYRKVSEPALSCRHDDRTHYYIMFHGGCALCSEFNHERVDN